MARLADLPPEVLLQVLAHLSTIDLPTFLTSQATCRAFRLLALDILSRPPTAPSWPAAVRTEEDSAGPPRCGPHPLLARSFGPLLSSAGCFTRAERERVRWFLSLNGDVTLPFRRLPWARDARRRERYLRAGASWRGLSVTLGRGPPVTRVEIVKSYSSGDSGAGGRADHVQHLEADVPAGGFLTMGLLYDLLLCGGGGAGDERAATLGGETGGWELLLGSRLRSRELLLEYECFVADDEDLVDRGPGAAQSAILFVRGGTVEGADQDRRFGELEEEEGEVEWVPEMLGDAPKIRLAST